MGENTETQITRAEIDSHLDAVLASPGFRGAPKYASLLRYLVDRSLADDTPHEIDIAVDVFGRDESYDPAEHSSVRVCVHHLRRKLEDFYAGQPPAARVRFSIPKGSYRLSFGTSYIASEARTPASGQPLRWSRAFRLWPAVTGTLLVCSLLGNALLLERLTRTPSSDRDRQDLAAVTGAEPTVPDGAAFAWADIVEGEEPILIALGDFFFFSDTSAYPDRVHFIRDVHINSREDLEETGTAVYGRAVQPSSMTYLPKAAAFALQALLPVAERTGKTVSLKLMSEVTGEDLRQNDVIYIGFVRSMGALQEYFFRSSNFASEPPYLVLRHKSTGKTFASSGDVYGQMQDYGLFSKMAGPGRGELVVFTGIHDVGIQHAVRAFTDPKRVGELARELGSGAERGDAGIEVLFSVSGYNRSDLEASVAMAASVDVVR